MKKSLLLFGILFFAVLLIPHIALADPLVTCGNDPSNPCTLQDLFAILPGIFNWLMIIAIPLAGLMITIGGVLMLLSGVNASWFAKGKSMVIWSLIAVLIIMASVLIIDALFKALGYGVDWNMSPFGG